MCVRKRRWRAPAEIVLAFRLREAETFRKKVTYLSKKTGAIVSVWTDVVPERTKTK